MTDMWCGYICQRIFATGLSTQHPGLWEDTAGETMQQQQPLGSPAEMPVNVNLGLYGSTITHVERELSSLGAAVRTVGAVPSQVQAGPKQPEAIYQGPSKLPPKTG